MFCPRPRGTQAGAGSEPAREKPLGWNPRREVVRAATRAAMKASRCFPPSQPRSDWPPGEGPNRAGGRWPPGLPRGWLLAPAPATPRLRRAPRAQCVHPPHPPTTYLALFLLPNAKGKDGEAVEKMGGKVQKPLPERRGWAGYNPGVQPRSARAPLQPGFLGAAAAHLLPRAAASLPFSLPAPHCSHFARSGHLAPRRRRRRRRRAQGCQVLWARYLALLASPCATRWRV